MHVNTKYMKIRQWSHIIQVKHPKVTCLFVVGWCVSIVNYYARTGTEGSNSKNMDVWGTVTVSISMLSVFPSVISSSSSCPIHSVCKTISAPTTPLKCQWAVKLPTLVSTSNLRRIMSRSCETFTDGCLDSGVRTPCCQQKWMDSREKRRLHSLLRRPTNNLLLPCWLAPSWLVVTKYFIVLPFIDKDI